MELVLVRHAQPEWNRDDIAQVDPGLTRVGRTQARLAADRLGGQLFDHLLISTAQRALQTAQPVLRALSDVPYETREWLHEIHMPSNWQDTPSHKVTQALRDARARPRDQWWEGMPGGESFNDFHARVTIGLTAELGEHGVERRDDRLWHVPERPLRLLLVAHAGTNSVILGHLLGLEPEPWEWERFASDHASITVIRATRIADGHIFSLQSFSDVAHLPSDLLTS